MLLLEGDKIERFELFGDDTDELLRTIEASFGVQFNNEELFSAVDVQSLANCVYKKLTGRLSEQCLSSIVFYRLRRTFISSLNLTRAAITPKTSLVKLLPWKDRKRRWREIQNHLEYELTGLTFPAWLLALSAALTTSLFILPILKWHLFAFYGGSLFEILAALSFLVVVVKLLSPLARQFPNGYEIFSDLVKLTLAHNYGKISTEHGISSELEVLGLLRRLIAEETGLDIRKVSPETRFPEGLNIY